VPLKKTRSQAEANDPQCRRRFRRVIFERYEDRIHTNGTVDGKHRHG
jgi:hypothetical protein